jgi:hypothetical protein
LAVEQLSRDERREREAKVVEDDVEDARFAVTSFIVVKTLDPDMPRHLYRSSRTSRRAAWSNSR